MAKIVKLTTENVKRISAVEIEPNGNVVILGGKNEAGKSSVLDSIMYALCGKSALPKQPLRDGEKKGKIVVKTDEYTVTRTFTEAGGGTLKVEDNKNGASFKSPQAILDKMVGSLTVNPLAFLDSDEKKQLETLKLLVGLDFSQLDAESKKLYEERTIVNREGKELSARYDAMENFEDAPAEEVSVSELMQKMATVEEHNKKVNAAFENLEWCEDSTERAGRRVAQLKHDLEKAEEEHAKAKEKESEANKRVKDIGEIKETDSIRQQISGAEDINSKVRSNKQRAELGKKLESKREESRALTEKINSISADKAKQLENAKFPIEGLSFDENGVIYQGVPLSQASGAGRLRVGASIAEAMNPELRIMLVRDASLLDEDGMKIISDFAEEKDMQVWLERVGDKDESAIIIEDGAIKE